MPKHGVTKPRGVSIVQAAIQTTSRPPAPKRNFRRQITANGAMAGTLVAEPLTVFWDQHPDWFLAMIWLMAKSLGLSGKRERECRAWGEEADRMLIACEEFEMKVIEKRMKRSIASIRSRLAVIDRGTEFFGGFKTKDLMEMLHLDKAAIRRLERKRLLLRERGRITEASVISLCSEHPEEIPFETLDEDTKRMLVPTTNYTRYAGSSGMRKVALEHSARDPGAQIV